MKKILGTAQFAGRYGLLDMSADLGNLREMFNVASTLGFDTVDTAPSYGNAENLIRDFNWQGRVHTKFEPRKDPITSLRESLRRLDAESVEIGFFHDPMIVSDPRRLEAESSRLRESGLCDYVGVSIYERDDFSRAVNQGHVNAVQVPINLFDRRISDSDFEEAKEAGILILGRSVFLQGVLLQNPNSLPTQVSALRDPLFRLSEFSAESGLSVLQLLLAWVLRRPGVWGLVLGVENVSNLRGIAEAFEAAMAEEAPLDGLWEIFCSDPGPLDPRNW